MTIQHWHIKKRTEVLLRVVKEFSDDSRMSLEGDFSGLRVFDLPGVSQDETAVLRRNTLRPKQDFVVVPLAGITAEQLLSAIGGNVPRKIRHIQVEQDGRIEFAAYDSFHPECIVFGPAFRREFLEELIADGILEKAKY
jgi:hypothetical protein